MNIINDLEKNILEIYVSYLSNSENAIPSSDIIQFEDINITLDMFKSCFFDNNYEFFELNNQFSEYEEFLIHNKTIKNGDFKFMKYKTNKNSDLPSSNSGNVLKRTNKVILIDIMSNKFICNKKMKINDIKKIAFIKDINKYNSLFDFKIYNHHLSFDDIISIYNHHPNKNNKNYFRFKIITSYYSNELDETISVCFNYLVETPKEYNTNLIDINQPEQDIILNDNIPDKLNENNIKIDNNNNNNSLNNLFNSKENIVYSNYNRNKNDNIVLNNNDVLKSSENKNMTYSNYKNYVIKNNLNSLNELEESDLDEDESNDEISYSENSDRDDDMFLNIA